MLLPDLTIQAIVVRILALLILVGIHGVVIAGTAVLLGDRGPRYDGRLTLAPAGHVDLAGAIGLVLFGWGWSKPVAIEPGKFLIGRVGAVVVILAGFVGLLVTALLLDALIRPALTMLPHTAGLTTAAFLHTATGLTIGFALFSLFPVPPLAGGLLLEAVGLRVPSRLHWIFALLLLAAAATGIVRQLLGPPQAALASLVLGQ